MSCLFKERLALVIDSISADIEFDGWAWLRAVDGGVRNDAVESGPSTRNEEAGLERNVELKHVVRRAANKGVEIVG